MKTDIIVQRFKHYDMGDNRGLNIVIDGEPIQTNNETGIQQTESPVPYEEIAFLKTFGPDSFPAKFKANIEFTRVKDKNGKEKTGIAFKNLEYVCKMKLVEDKKAS